MINFSLVDVKSITSNQPRSNFAEADLENLADIIIETGGIIRPLVLKTIDIESYTVIDGHFEYYAAVRAREKNPRQGEMVNAFVIASKLEDLVLQQVAFFKKIDSSIQSVKPQFEVTNLEPRLTNLELRLEKQFNEFRSEFIHEKQRIDNHFKQLESFIPKQSEQSSPLSLLNSLDKDELSRKLQRSRIRGSEKLAKDIFDARCKKPKQQFEDYHDVVKSVKNLGDKTILTIIDEWSRSY